MINEESMKAVIALFMACMAVLTTVPSCSEHGTPPPVVEQGQTPAIRDYRLVINDSEKEVRTKDTGDVMVPWAEGMTGRRFESTALTVKEGFVLPQSFFDHWQDELTRVLVTYWQITGDTYADFGWVWYKSQGNPQEELCIKFKEPLPFWPASGDRIETTASAYIMKFDTISLFDPRGSKKGKPELEGDLNATLVCTNISRAPGTIVFDYTLNISGQGVMRYYNPTGEEWLLGADEEDTRNDKEEPCNIEITRDGVKEFSKDTSGTWYLVRDIFSETWHAESQESDMIVHESSLSGPGQTYSLSLSDLPERGQRAKPIASVYDFGAAGDGNTLDTQAINAAIEACNHQGGGTVYFPPGVFVSGSIRMKSNVTLKLEEGALLRGTTDMTQYDPRENNPWNQYQDDSHSYFHRSLIWGEDLENIAFIGPGIIDGNDAFEPWPIINKTPPPPIGWLLSTLLYQINDDLFQRGPKPIALKSCTNILIKDITIMHAPDEAILATGCDSVFIDGFTAREVRVDGIDPDGCNKVTITNCEIKSLDDSVAIKSGYALGTKKSCEDITVKDSLLSTFINALKIGTESVGDFKNIVFQDCTIHNLLGFPSFAGLSMISVDGGTIDGLIASNITMKNVNYPIFIRLGDRLRSPENPPIGNVRNIMIRNVTATGGIGIGASSITSVPGSYVGGGIQLHDIAITCKGGGHLLSSYLPYPEIQESHGVYPDPPYTLPGRPPAYGFFCRHATGVEFRNVTLGFETLDHRAALIGEDVRGLQIDTVDAERSPGSAPSIIIR
jgi:hypothetical protein